MPISRQNLGEADAGTRTRDPFITSEVLYQLSYVGVYRDFPDSPTPVPGFQAAPGLQNLGWSLLQASVTDASGACSRDDNA